MMKLDLEKYGLEHLKCGMQVTIPKTFANHLDLLFKGENEIYAVVHEKRLNDVRTYQKVLILLNQLCRYYHCPVTIYCLSYRSLCSDEKIYTTFKQRPASIF